MVPPLLALSIAAPLLPTVLHVQGARVESAGSGGWENRARGPRLLCPVFIETICFHYFNQWCYYVYSETLSKWNHVENAINE